MIAAVIPIHGRLSLVRYTIERLIVKNGVDLVICVGDKEEELLVCTKAGARFYAHKNKPLGEKWNFGFQMARMFNPEAILYMGSSDWVSDNWIPTLKPYFDHDLIGKYDFNMVHVGKEITSYRHERYPKTRFVLKMIPVHKSVRTFFKPNRDNEPVGIGRILTRKFLNSINWTPFYDDYDKSMDWCMMQKLKKVNGSLYVYQGEDIQSLSVSSDKWNCKHKIDTRIHKELTKEECVRLFINFPEITNFVWNVRRV